jgi:glucose-1-phosphatase
MPPPEALLFDLGGVLVDIDFTGAFHFWSRYTDLPVEEMRRRYSFDAAYELHETGQLASSEYFAHLAHTLELQATPAEIEAGWNAIFKGELTRTLRLVERARASLPCYAFTNTNASHMARWSMLFPSVVNAFSRIFASHEIGMRKPDLGAFHYVCEAIGVEPSKTLFFDDLPANVAAAKAAGLQAVVVRSPLDVEDALRPILKLGEA